MARSSRKGRRIGCSRRLRTTIPASCWPPCQARSGRRCVMPEGQRRPPRSRQDDGGKPGNLDISRVGKRECAMPRRRAAPRLYLDPRRKTWIIRAGALFIRTGCAENERALAEKRLAEYLGAKHEPERGPDPLIADVLLVYARERLPQTRAVRKAAYNVGSLAKWWGDKRVSQITPSNCLSYAENRTPSAARRDLEVLSAALRWWHKHREALPSVPSLVMPPKSEPRDRWLTRSEAARLLWAARHTEHLKRFILLGLYTGSRSGVILSLEWSWIDLERGVMRRRARGQAEASTKRTPPVRLGRKILSFLRRLEAVSS